VADKLLSVVLLLTSLLMFLWLTSDLKPFVFLRKKIISKETKKELFRAFSLLPN